MIPSLRLFIRIPSVPFKRSQTGLYHGKMIQFGNSVPFSKHKTRRTWLPNVQRKRLYSDALHDHIRIKVTTTALRTLRKYGGLDQYLLKTKPELLGITGMRLRIAVREAIEKNEPKEVVEARRAAEKLKAIEEKRTFWDKELLKRKRRHELLMQKERSARALKRGEVVVAEDATKSEKKVIMSDEEREEAKRLVSLKEADAKKAKEKVKEETRSKLKSVESIRESRKKKKGRGGLPW